MIAIGVDPGLSGAIAAVSTTDGLLCVVSMPTISNGSDGTIKRKVDARALREVLQQWSRRYGFAAECVTGVIERMAPFSAGPAGPTTLLSLGISAGIADAVLSEFVQGVILQPTPQAWKKSYGLTKARGEPKQSPKDFKAESVRLVQLTYPHAGKVSHDKAEAILLALWGLGQVNGQVRHVDQVQLEDQFAVEAA